MGLDLETSLQQKWAVEITNFDNLYCSTSRLALVLETYILQEQKVISEAFRN